MQHLEGSDTPVLYVGRTVLKGIRPFLYRRSFKWSILVHCYKKSKINLKYRPPGYQDFWRCTVKLKRQLLTL